MFSFQEKNLKEIDVYEQATTVLGKDVTRLGAWPK